ncbi:hypothetical protein BU23DRAFT_556924 [Bimuria novae-zelandiae CBS 107.79]|uniref:Uncharacterized protein n=1 Tax=Bimuria novae-zelandiae CBS 107.79 TaxID=1447943 RepID=A0A6A5V1Z0_9PLEO|nr:hypothetical protein BU23DRAFT_556924 [Bimuria novae-zelandiae CBS 107.79]
MTAAIAVGADSQGPLEVPRLVVPRFERPPPDYNQKRATVNMCTFGTFITDNESCPPEKPCKLEEPIDQNGRPHPWCQAFSGSNGYSPMQSPSIESIVMGEPPNTKNGDMPQWVCFFYNNFDCDPSKDAGLRNQTTSIAWDHMIKGQPNAVIKFNQTVDAVPNSTRYTRFKAYVCMMYADAPYRNDGDGSGSSAEGFFGADGNGGDAQDLTEGGLKMTADGLYAGQDAAAEAAPDGVQGSDAGASPNAANSTVVQR